MAKVVQLKSGDWFQLKITLKDVKPAIWRRFLVPSDIRLPDLHKVIQTVMRWSNSHLHQFVIDGSFYCLPDEDSIAECIDYRKIKLDQVMLKEKQVISYDYDFGDGWEHRIVLEKIMRGSDVKRAVCLAGKRHCPPEDCGGPYGYMDLLKVISDPNDEEHVEMMEWLGGEFDPEYFDIEEINSMLKQKDYGCVSLD
jgi:hypothetical protein